MRRILLLSCVCLLLSCVCLLLPRSVWAGPFLDLSRVDSLDLTGYRSLRRNDFSGAHAPAQFLHSQVLPVAVSCIYVVVNPGARIYAEPRIVDGVTTYIPLVSDLSFQAVLSKSCSWWNKQHGVSPAYVLEHEQIHFALYEVAARRLNESAEGLIRSLPVSRESAQAAVTSTQQFLQQSLNRTMQQIEKDNTRFDRETSFGFQPDRQHRWRKSVDGDLADLAAHAVDLDLRPRGKPNR